VNLVWRYLRLLTIAVGVGLSAAVFLPAVSAQTPPTVTITSPANGATVSNPVSVTVTSSGATIKAATDGDPNAAHFHYFIDRDPATVLQPGQPIPTGQPDIIHTPSTTQQLPNLTPGQHTVWVVLAHTDHTPFSPNVQAQVTFTVGAAPASAASAAPAGLPASGTGGLLGAHAGTSTSPWLLTGLLLAVVLLGSAAVVSYRRGFAQRG
jgi:hypothetical protein